MKMSRKSSIRCASPALTNKEQYDGDWSEKPDRTNKRATRIDWGGGAVASFPELYMDKLWKFQGNPLIERNSRTER